MAGQRSGSIKYKLTSGANLVSFPFHGLVGSKMTPAGIQSNLTVTGSLTGIIGQGEAASFLTSSNTWIGGLSTLNEKSGYWLILKSGSADEIFELTGSLVDADYSRNSTIGGMNLVSYPYTENYTLTRVLNDISGSNFNQIISEGGAASVVNGNWIGSLSTLTTGSGYWIRNVGGSAGGSSTNDIQYFNFTPTGSTPDASDLFTGSWNYTRCTDGGSPPTTDRLAREGYDCEHTQYWKDRYGDDRPIHSMGWYASTTNQQFWFLNDYFHGTASLQNANGQEISHSRSNGPPLVGFFTVADSGSLSGSLTCCSVIPWFSGKTDNEYAQSTVTDDIYPSFLDRTDSVDRIATAESESIYYASASFSHIMNLTLDDGVVGGPAGVPPSNGTVIYPRVYDPNRNRLYSAKFYNIHNEHVAITSSNQNTFTHFSVGAGGVTGSDGPWVTFLGHHYIKTDE